MSKILLMKMNNNRYYYKQGQSSKVPYLLAIVILALLYIMNGMNEDRKDADRMFNQVVNEFKSTQCDSVTIKQHKKEVDSLNEVIDWYKSQQKKPTYKKPVENKKTTPDKPVSIVTKDTL